MIFTLERYRLSETVTDGQLKLPDGITLVTLERPWLPGARGGVPFASCVPDGEYQLERFTRPNGDVVLRLWNSDLGVYRHQGDVPEEGGRYLILLHSANWVHQLGGCGAPGVERVIDNDGKPMVTNSRVAMRAIMQAFDNENPPGEPIRDAKLLIKSKPGAIN